MVQSIDLSVLGGENILVTFYLIFYNIFVLYNSVYRRDLFHKKKVDRTEDRKKKLGESLKWIIYAECTYISLKLICNRPHLYTSGVREIVSVTKIS